MASAESKNSLPDLLKLEGVIAKGYGTISKTVMSDHSLSISAKAIILYLCSLSGKGEIFPGRDRILKDLKMSKKTYYAAIKQLIEKGYIRVERVRSQGKYQHNIYYIPTKVTIENGYGMIPHIVMTDSRLSALEKVCYGYISSYSGAQNVTTLKPQIMQLHLGIGRTARHEAIKKLRECNYLNTTQIHTNGRLTDLVMYSLITNPDEANKSKASITAIAFEKKTELNNTDICPDPLDGDTAKQSTVTGDMVKQSTATGDMVIQSTAKEDMVKEDTVKEDTVQGDTTNNSSLPLPVSINTSFVTDMRGQMVAAITEKIQFDELLRIYASEPKTLLALSSLMEFIQEVYFDPQPLYALKEQRVSAHYVRYLFDHYDIRESVTFALEGYRTKSNSVKNIKAYITTCFLNHLYSLRTMFPTEGDMVQEMQIRFGNAEYYGNLQYVVSQ